jgi:tRNA (mo5U34)-methyltransferase
MSSHLISPALSKQLPMLESELLRKINATEPNQQQALLFAIFLNNLAVVYHAQGKFPDSEVMNKRCLAVLEGIRTSIGARHVAQSLANCAALYRTLHEFHEAERLFQLAVKIWDQEGWPAENEMTRNLEESFSSSEPGMLWAEVIEKEGMLRFFGREVQRLQESNPQALQQTVAKMGPWYHDVELTPHFSTYPTNRHYMKNRWRFLKEFVPDDLSGKSVLDIGCNAGFFSLEMKKRNADRVVGIDVMPYCLAQARFLSHWFQQPLELRQIGAYDIESLGQFDIVLFIGVLYHLRHPLYALDKVASICKETMYLQSLLRGDTTDFEPADNYPYEEQAIFKRPEFPRMYFIEKSFNSDQSNWWVPNSSCLKAMARAAGFRKIEPSGHPEIIICRK